MINCHDSNLVMEYSSIDITDDCDLYLDGVYIATLRDSGSLKLTVADGMHKLTFKLKNTFSHGVKKHIKINGIEYVVIINDSDESFLFFTNLPFAFCYSDTHITVISSEYQDWCKLFITIDSKTTLLSGGTQLPAFITLADLNLKRGFHNCQWVITNESTGYVNTSPMFKFWVNARESFYCNFDSHYIDGSFHCVLNTNDPHVNSGTAHVNLYLDDSLVFDTVSDTAISVHGVELTSGLHTYRWIVATGNAVYESPVYEIVSDESKVFEENFPLRISLYSDTPFDSEISLTDSYGKEYYGNSIERELDINGSLGIFYDAYRGHVNLSDGTYKFSIRREPNCLISVTLTYDGKSKSVDFGFLSNSTFNISNGELVEFSL